MGEDFTQTDVSSLERDRVEMLAMTTLMDEERGLGYEPVNISWKKNDYDLESKFWASES